MAAHHQVIAGEADPEVLAARRAQRSDQHGPVVGAEVGRLDGTLRRTFGYNQFEIIGQSHRALQNGESSWLAVSKHFSLRVDPRGVTSDGYRVNLQLFQDRQLLLETDATLSKSSPLVIKGPQIGAGQLLLLLVVQ
jgi:hypothetical protein